MPGEAVAGVAMAELSAGRGRGEEDCGLEKKREGNREAVEEGEDQAQNPRKWVRATASSAPLSQGNDQAPQCPVGWAQAWLTPGRVLWGSYSGKWREEELKILNNEHLHLENDGHFYQLPTLPTPMVLCVINSWKRRYV